MSGELYSKTPAVNRVFLWISWFLKRSGGARNRAQKKWGKQVKKQEELQKSKTLVGDLSPPLWVRS